MLEFITAYRYYSFQDKDTPKGRSEFLNTFQKVCEEMIPSDLEVKVSEIQIDEGGRLILHIEGNQPDDEQFVANIFREMMGQKWNRKEIKRGQIVRGFMRDVGKVGFGIFIDVGISGPDKEILIPLFELRRQLGNDQILSTREIIQKYGFTENFPVDVEITRYNENHAFVEANERIEGIFAPQFIEQLKEAIFKGNDIVYTSGVSRQKIKKTLAIRGHTIDILEVQRLGPMETAIICKEGTFAPGILSHIGPDLSMCRLAAFVPAKVKRFWKTEKSTKPKKDQK
jgi:hypothetical protein